MPGCSGNAGRNTPVAYTATDIPAGELEDYLKELFAIADTNGDGVLQPEEAQKLLSLSGLGISQEKIDQMIRNADLNGDGVIDYNEFVPLARALLQGVEPMGAGIINHSNTQPYGAQWERAWERRQQEIEQHIRVRRPM